jgi:hypothetical protein
MINYQGTGNEFTSNRIAYKECFILDDIKTKLI